MRGITLLEAMVCFLLLAVVGAVALVLFARMFADTRGLDVRHHAAINFEAVTEVFTDRAKENWPSPVSTTGIIDGFAYRVDDQGLVRNPVGSATLSVKRLVLTLDYRIRNADGSEENRQIKSAVLVGN